MVQQTHRQRELHPVAAEAMAKYTAVWEENDRLIEENQQLRKDNEALRAIDNEKSVLISNLRDVGQEAQRMSDDRIEKLEMHYRERLAEVERAKESYLRYAVTISERLKIGAENITQAHKIAMEMASKVDDQVPDIDAVQPDERIEKVISDLESKIISGVEK
jgi:hypothetical protein